MIVLDSSAILCLVKGENGCQLVNEVLENSFINTVNWSEVSQKCFFYDINKDIVRQRLINAGVTISSFSIQEADIAASIWVYTRHISLADRACLATAMYMGFPVISTDTDWKKLSFHNMPKIIFAR